MIFATIWNDFLYQPMFNLLIWLYNNWTDQNLGWAVVYLTIILRVALLPLSLISERNKYRRNEEVRKEVEKVSKSLKKDPILMKQEIRGILKKKKVKPWSKMIVLGIQALVLVLLYQVFLRGITGEKILKILYPAVDFPGKINAVFYGFELGATHDIIWPAIVALFLITEIYLGFRRQKYGFTKSDLAYFILFPLATFIVLWILPMVKSLFILTSIIISVIIGRISKMLFQKTKGKDEDGEESEEEYKFNPLRLGEIIGKKK